MDKYEYKVRADEIKALIAEGDFAEAVKIADTIDWRRVKSVMMLCSVSDLYKINRRYQESKDILLLAYEKHPTGRLIVYSLCELAIKMEEYVQAIEYYKEFVQIAPRDTGRYILQYRLYEAQDVSLEERIAVLEEFKKRDYREKWAYELAYLYHRIGLTTKCVEECDEMYLWFGEGKYVLKALELKALHTPLNADQQAKYDGWIAARNAQIEEEQEDELDEEDEEDDREEDDIDYPEDEDEEDDADYPEDEEEEDDADYPEDEEDDADYPEDEEDDADYPEDEEDDADYPEDEEDDADYPEDEEDDADYPEDEEDDADYPEEDDDGIASIATAELPEVKTVDVGQYNTLNLQMALAESMKEILTDEESGMESDEESGVEPIPEPVLKEPVMPAQKAQVIEMPHPGKEEPRRKPSVEEAPEEPEEDIESDSIVEKIIAPLLQETVEMPKVKRVQATDELEEIVAKDIPEAPAPVQVRPEPAASAVSAAPVPPVEPTAPVAPEPVIARPQEEAYAEMPKKESSSVRYDDVLSQENDGQIRLVVPDVKTIEKQITGQLSIEDIMAEWEAMKKSNEQKRMEAVRQRILEHTGSLFADFDEATKSGLLEQLEKAFVAAIMKESGKPEIKRVVLPEDTEEELHRTAKPKKKNAPKPVKEELTEEDSASEMIQEEPDVYEEEPEELEEAEEIEEAYEADEVEELEAAAEIEESEDGAEARDIDDKIIRQEITAKPAPRSPYGTSQGVRELTEEEKTLFGQFVHHKKSREQLIRTLDNMSMAAYTGNVIITGEEGSDTLSLAKGLIREMQYNDNNFSGKVAKISGTVLNKKDIPETLARINNGALIIEKAADLKAETVARLSRALEKDNIGLLLILEDTKQRMNRLLVENSILNYSFELRIDIEPLDDEALVAYAKQYAAQMEYSIDEFGVLALHTRIADMQTSDHEVSVAEVRELVDEAIYYANKKTPKHFVDILLAKRYDEEDMIILRENDFMHY